MSELRIWTLLWTKISQKVSRLNGADPSGGFEGSIGDQQPKEKLHHFNGAMFASKT